MLKKNCLKLILNRNHSYEMGLKSPETKLFQDGFINFKLMLLSYFIFSIFVSLVQTFLLNNCRPKEKSF